MEIVLNLFESLEVAHIRDRDEKAVVIPGMSYNYLSSDGHLSTIVRWQQTIFLGRLDGVELIQKAIWSEECEINFQSEGSDAGRLEANLHDGFRVIATRLKQILGRESGSTQN
jgi:hypothetical protein